MRRNLQMFLASVILCGVVACTKSPDAYQQTKAPAALPPTITDSNYLELVFHGDAVTGIWNYLQTIHYFDPSGFSEDTIAQIADIVRTVLVNDVGLDIRVITDEDDQSGYEHAYRRQKIIITADPSFPINQYIQKEYGGLSIPGSFAQQTGDPAFVFSVNLTKNDSWLPASEILHEFGHTCSLYHPKEGYAELNEIMRPFQVAHGAYHTVIDEHGTLVDEKAIILASIKWIKKS